MTTPVLPYAGTSGWSGSTTSQERALRDDSTGRTRLRQERTLGMLAATGPAGLTYQELGDIFGWHHGKSSGALSVLHKDGQIARLTERRNRCAVYVLPEFVHGRPTAQHGQNKRNQIEAVLARWLTPDAQGQSKADQAPTDFITAMRKVTGIEAP